MADIIPLDQLPKDQGTGSGEQASSSIIPIDKLPDSPDASSPAQDKVNTTADSARNLAGRIALAATPPENIGAKIAAGTLFKADPLEGKAGAVIDGALQSATFGIPKAIASKILESKGLKYPEVSDENKTAENIGKVIGLIVPGEIAGSIASKIPDMTGSALANDIVRGISTGAMTGFSESPDKFSDINQRIKQAGYGIALGAAVPVIAKGIEGLYKAGMKSEELAGQVRASLFEAKSSIGKEFEGKLNDLIEKNPSQVVSLEEAFTNLNAMSQDNTRLISDLKLGAKRSGLDPELIDGFIKDPSSASQMTLNQTRELKQAISNVPGIKANYAKGKFAAYSDHQIDLLDFADQIKKSQLGAFKELANINKTYSEKMAQYDLIKGKFKVGQLLNNIEKNFGDKEVQKIVNGILPKETIDAMGGYRMATKFLRAAGWTSTVGLAGAVGELGWKFASGH